MNEGHGWAPKGFNTSLKSEGFPMYCMSESFNGNTQNSVDVGGTVSGLLVTYTCPLNYEHFKLLFYIQQGAYKKGKLGMGVGEMNENELSVIHVLKTVIFFCRLK